MIEKQLLYYPTVTREEFRNMGRITELIESNKLTDDLGLPPLNAAEDRVMLCGSPGMLVDLKHMLEAPRLQGRQHLDAGRLRGRARLRREVERTPQMPEAKAAARKPARPSPRRAAPACARPRRRPRARASCSAATKVFAKYGYDGGSVEKISKAAKSYDRMIYYYFGSKEGLFIAVLEGIYRRMDDAEAAIELDASRPVETLTAVIRFVLGYYRKNPEFVTLLNTENLHKGRHIAKSLRAREYSSRAISIISEIARQRRRAGPVPRRRGGARPVPADRLDRLLLHVEPAHADRLPRRAARDGRRPSRTGKTS